MGYLSNNLSWMLFNVLLASIPVVLTYLLRAKPPIVVRSLLLIVWFLYLPNTIYLITDIQYLPHQIIDSSLIYKILLPLEYAALILFGIVTFMISLEPFESILSKYKIKGVGKDFSYILLNFIVAFAVVLGKSQRTHSWDVFINTQKVILDIQRTITDSSLLLFILFFGIISNIIYFSLREFFDQPKKIKKRKRS